MKCNCTPLTFDFISTATNSAVNSTATAVVPEKILSSGTSFTTYIIIGLILAGIIAFFMYNRQNNK